MLDEEIKKLKIGAEGLNLSDNAIVQATNTLLSAIKRRVHNDGKDSDNNTISNTYSLIHRSKRVSKGRQVSYVDLEIEGDLRRDLQTFVSNNKLQIGYQSDEQGIIAASHEDRYGKEIFTPSDEEIEDYLEILLDVASSEIVSKL